VFDRYIDTRYKTDLHVSLDEYAEKVSAKKIERIDREFRAQEL